MGRMVELLCFAVVRHPALLQRSDRVGTHHRRSPDERMVSPIRATVLVQWQRPNQSIVACAVKCDWPSCNNEVSNPGETCPDCIEFLNRLEIQKKTARHGCEWLFSNRLVHFNVEVNESDTSEHKESRS